MGDAGRSSRRAFSSSLSVSGVPCQTTWLVAPLISVLIVTLPPATCDYAFDVELAPLNKLITLRAKLSGAVYCNRSCLWVCLFVSVCVCVCVCVWAVASPGFYVRGAQVWRREKTENNKCMS